MRSSASRAEVERVLVRAAEELDPGTKAWFGAGLAQRLRDRRSANGLAQPRGPTHVAFVEVERVSPTGRARVRGEEPTNAERVIGLCLHQIEELPSLFHPGCSGTQLDRLICPVAVFDFWTEGPVLKEIRHGLTAADVQQEIGGRLWAGPDLKELGRH